jgi:hypothetical protein
MTRTTAKLSLPLRRLEQTQSIAQKERIRLTIEIYLWIYKLSRKLTGRGSGRWLLPKSNRLAVLPSYLLGFASALGPAQRGFLDPSGNLYSASNNRR